MIEMMMSVMVMIRMMMAIMVIKIIMTMAIS